MLCTLFKQLNCAWCVGMASRLFQNCRSENCVVCGLDCAQNRLDCDKNRLDCDKNRLDCDKPTRFGPCSTRLSAQLTRSKNRLDAKPSTQLCATFHSDSTLFESILEQSSPFAHANHSHTRHLATPTGHAQ